VFGTSCALLLTGNELVQGGAIVREHNSLYPHVAQRIHHFLLSRAHRSQELANDSCPPPVSSSQNLVHDSHLQFSVMVIFALRTISNLRCKSPSPTGTSCLLHIVSIFPFSDVPVSTSNHMPSHPCSPSPSRHGPLSPSFRVGQSNIAPLTQLELSTTTSPMYHPSHCCTVRNRHPVFLMQPN
jgi:hypothetical protein